MSWIPIYDKKFNLIASGDVERKIDLLFEILRDVIDKLEDIEKKLEERS